ncbi:hypothetical protein BCR35DRAFT_300380 [Leucosporidium creatinivorum]|uniref:Uncharacterized protein n=1 Tax=Leucosporidium creatinivorum TaxID=106004 RepID=A0A1Y2FYT3_9BASI|nr:hypothetical protein BCR35DRAFT_300380 [Leucosporidium creatinivorum]
MKLPARIVVSVGTGWRATPASLTASCSYILLSSLCTTSAQHCINQHHPPPTRLPARLLALPLRQPRPPDL